MARQVSDTPATSHFNFVYGQYKLGNGTVPYFSTVMSLLDAAESLNLASEMTGKQKVDWSLEELYQRDVDWSRVEQKIVPYLMADDQPKFFNSLTIALMPVDSTGRQFAELDSQVWSPPGLAEPERFQKKIDVGPFSFGYWDDWKRLDELGALTGQVRWNSNQVFAVAIDGQHRLAAIQHYVQFSGQSKEVLRATSVPVILLILSDKCGYERVGTASNVDVLRRFFIDLNKHAQSVSRARQILLDDNDPISLSVRAFVENKLSFGFGCLTEQPPKLSLSLVDWHTEQAKFEDGPYVTTILGLDWIVAKCLDTKSINDLTDYGAIRAQIKRLRGGLGLQLDDAMARLKDLEEFKQAPFNYRNGELCDISTSFTKIWNAPLIHLFTEFTPYKSLIKLREKQTSTPLLDSAEFVNWYCLKKKKEDANNRGRAAREYNSFVQNMQNRSESPISETRIEDWLEEIESLKTGNLAFNVAFQRAYFLAFKEFRTIKGAQLDELGPYDEDYDVEEILDLEADESETIEETLEDNSDTSLSETIEVMYLDRAQSFVSSMNDLIRLWGDFLDINARFSHDGTPETESFWLGSLKKAEGGIDFTQGASKRAADLIFLSAAMHTYDGINDPENRSSFDDFIEAVNSGDNGFLRRVKRAIVRLKRKEASLGGRILQSMDKEFTDESSNNEVLKRLEFLWNSLEL